MSNDYKISLIGDDSNLKKTLNDDKQALGQVGAQADAANKSISDFAAQVNKAAGQTSNYRTKLANLTKTIQDLSINYSQLSQAEKNSQFGQEMLRKIEQLKTKAAEYKDAIGDVQAEITAMSSDTAGWDATKQAIQTSRDVLSAFVAVTDLAGGNTEKLQKVIAKLAQIQTICNAAITLGNTLNKSSILIMQIKNLQMKLLTRATQAQTVATGAATVAQRLFNAAVSANPYVIAATLILGICSALYEFISMTDDADDKIDEQKKKVEEAKKEWNDWKDTIGKMAGEAIGKFKTLQTEYQRLRTEGSKTKWIEDNKNAFHQLGIEINNIKQADNAFIANSKNVIEALKQRAIAAAYATKAQEIAGKIVQREMEIDNQPDMRRRGGNDVSRPEDAPGARYKDDPQLKQLNDQLSQILNKMSNTQDSYKEILSQAGVKEYSGEKSGKTTTAKEPDIKEPKTYYEGLKDKLQNLTNARNGVDITVDTKEAMNSVQLLNKEISKTQAEIDFFEITVGIKEAPKKEAISSLKKLENEEKELADKLANIDITITPQQDIDALFGQLKAKQQEIENYKIKLHLAEPIPAAGSIAGLQARINDLNAQIDIEVNPQLRDQMLKDLKEMQMAMEKLNMTSEDYTRKQVDGARSVIQGLGGIYSAWSGLEDLGDKNVFEQFLTVSDAIFTTIETIQTLGETINWLNGLFEIWTVASETQAATETASAETQVAANTMKAASYEALGATTMATDEAMAGVKVQTAAETFAANQIAALSNQVLTSTENTAAYASIPFVGPALAAAAQAIYTGLWAAANIPMFADGGIVGGNSATGDKLVARLNSGEMVLNKREQANLYSMLNSSSDNAPVQTFVIRGTDLYATLSNYTNKRNKLL